MYSNISLTGNNKANLINLIGTEKSFNSEPIYITKIKKRIFELFIIPLERNNWNIITQNMFTYDNLFTKISKYYKIQPSDDLNMYITILKVILQLNGEYNTFNEKYKEDFNGLAKFEEVMPTIKLAPAYELYNLILGKPNNKIYDDFKIAKINELLKDDNTNFNDIKNKIF